MHKHFLFLDYLHTLYFVLHLPFWFGLFVLIFVVLQTYYNEVQSEHFVQCFLPIVLI